MVIIDGPPRVYDVARSAIMASDLVLIRSNHRLTTYGRPRRSSTLIHEATVYKPNLKSAFVINRKIVNTAIGRDVVEALSEYPMPVSKRQFVSESPLPSRGPRSDVFERTPTCRSKEMRALVEEIMELAA